MTARGTFVFSIHDLDLAGRDAEFTITPAWVRGALEGCELQPAGPDGRLDVHLTKTGNEILVQGQVDVELTIPCARCLAPVELRPHIELALLLFPSSSGGPPARREGPSREPSPDDGDVDTYEGDEVVLDRF